MFRQKKSSPTKPPSGRVSWWRRTRLGRAVRRTAIVLAVFLLTPVAFSAIYRFAPPPVTPLMVIRAIEGDGAARQWRSLEELPDAVPLAVLAAEDNRFCAHNGFDWEAIGDAIEEARAGEGLRGASTISMQLTRNLFLWPGGGWLRKGLEALWTPVVELFLGKRRIVEVYLNVAEMGQGVFGIEAAARRHYGKSAADLTAREAAGIAAILPNPRGWSPGSGYAAERTPVLQRRMRDIAPLADCVSD